MDMVNRISSIVQQITDLPQKDNDEVFDLLEHNEWGIALETFCSALVEEKLLISVSIYNEIKQAGEMMELDSLTWKDLFVK